MKPMIRFLAICLMMIAVVGVMYGWGNATHVYFARHLGARVGPVNMQEMYGSLTTDMFNLLFAEQLDSFAANLHFNPDPLYAAADTPEKRAVAFGFMTHNNVWGVDLTAHGMPAGIPNPLWPPAKPGWVIKYGDMVGDALKPELEQILGQAGVPPGLAGPVIAGLAPTMGHDLVETAVDILVKRQLDPLIGLRMYIAAKGRSPQTGDLFADAYAGDLAAATGMELDQARQVIVNVEAGYQQAMMDYGQLFILPENQLIPTISGVSAGIAEGLIELTLEKYDGLPDPQGWDVTVPPSLVAQYINYSMGLVHKTYQAELAKTLGFVGLQLAAHHISTASICLAYTADQEPTEEQAEGATAVEAVPLSFGLGQNYPNPFNPSTEIRYQLAAPGQVSLKVFNSIGQEVATLVNEEKTAGEYRLTWDAAGLPSGAYFYRLECGSSVETKRMMLLK